MRVAIDGDTIKTDEAIFKKHFEQVAQKFNMNWSLYHSAQTKGVVILESRHTHCLADLLHRWHTNELWCDIPCVISNHREAESLVN